MANGGQARETTRRTALLGGATLAVGASTGLAQEQAPDRASLRQRALQRRAAATEAAAPVAVDVGPIRDRLPRTAAGIEAAAAAGRSGQIYVSLAGRTVADFAWGTTRLGGVLRPDCLVSWASAVKPTSCTAVLRFWEQGRFDLDDRVTTVIPEFGVNGKEDVRIRHLLTHTAHLGGYAGPTALPATWDDLVGAIVRAPRTPYRGAEGDELPKLGTGPGYNPAGIIVLAEIARRLDGRRPFERIVREDVYEPAGMIDSWCGMTVEAYRAYRSAGRFDSGYMDSEAEIVKCQPAGGGMGPTRELARFYEMMLGRGSVGGRRIVTPQTVEAMTSPKTGFGVMGIWGLAFNLGIPENSAPVRGEARRSERYGPRASPRVFGHGGASGMQAYADPEHGLVVAHIGRAAVDGAIYEDLGLA
jgi:CubicO group peptidase (beta-lactamase class C family)